MKPDASEKATPSDLIIPDCLNPSADFEDWRATISLDVLPIATEFSRQFGIDLEVSVASVLASVALALGGSIQFELPHTRVTSPFSVLVLTMEQKPVWTGVPLRFLRDGLEDYLAREFVFDVDSEAKVGSEQKFREAIDPAERLQNAKSRVRELLAGNILETIHRESVVAPFPVPPLDREVALGTPRKGLLGAIARLNEPQKLHLEDALSGTKQTSSASSGTSIATANFFWQLPEAKSKALFRQSAWLRDTPFLLLRTEEASFPNLDANSNVVKAFDNIGRRFLAERIQFSGHPRPIRLDSKQGKPVMEFLHGVQQWERESDDAYPLRWVAELGLKFTLILMRFREIEKPDPFLVECGFELAKHFARIHLKNFSAFREFLGAENADTADLSHLERQVYLKICEAKQITKADLRASFHQMSAAERDEIVSKLLAIGLIRQEGKFLMQNAA